eukprot:3251898-Pyramimonas_sp.AAC.2
MANAKQAVAEAKLEKARLEYKELGEKFEALLVRYTEYKGKYAVAVANEKKWADRLATLEEGEKVRPPPPPPSHPPPPRPAVRYRKGILVTMLSPPSAFTHA